MPLSIRLQRRGKIHKPFYHLVAADSRRARNGRFIEKLGYYDPNQEPSEVVLKPERIQYWYSKGAQLSTAVKAIVSKQKIALQREDTAVRKSK